MWRHTKDRIAQFEATSTRARLKTWIPWTRWAKSRDIQPLEAAATLVQEFVLHEARTGTGPSESAPRARWDHSKWCTAYQCEGSHYQGWRSA